MTSTEKYVLGYGEGAMAWMTSRSIDDHGAFLLPYLQPGLNLLDCGCGPGTVTFGFAKQLKPGRVVGLDQNAGQFAEVAAHAQSHGITNLEFMTGDAYALPFDAGQFDIVYASALLGNLRHPQDVVAELVRVTAPGGVIALKDFDHGGDMVYPLTPELEKSRELYQRSRAAHGHADVAGRQLRAWLAKAGCTLDYTHATYLEHTAGNGLRELIDRNNQLVGEILAPEYIEAGWATAAELQSHERAWEAFAARPDALFCAAWVEVIGIRPG